MERHLCFNNSKTVNFLKKLYFYKSYIISLVQYIYKSKFPTVSKLGVVPLWGDYNSHKSGVSCLPGMEIHKVRRPLMGLWRAARDSVEAVADYACLIVRLLVLLRPWRLLVSFWTEISV